MSVRGEAKRPLGKRQQNRINSQKLRANQASIQIRACSFGKLPLKAMTGTDNPTRIIVIISAECSAIQSSDRYLKIMLAIPRQNIVKRISLASTKASANSL